MLTVLIYLLVMVLVGGLLFLGASAVFGRSEELPPLPPGTTATVLPAENVTAADVKALRFQQTLRGYKASEVDWALDRLGKEIDSLRAQLADRGAGIGDVGVSGESETPR
ncbi:DivIVA domain-containing protein [Rhodococcus sp. OK519]|uniref:DivIVA domain-containing protein n=1 Tax=Rhodococcus sp. OK519 TaxID=2135729 RepID=UPI000D3D8E8B|nr:DivIVA domain-containing protein [Rhodococcus sp. OK519]